MTLPAFDPAFDVLPTLQSQGYQQMQVGADMADATLGNALSTAHLFGLKPGQAQTVVREVAGVVHQWPDHFQRTGLCAADMAVIAQHLDRPFLADQRRAWLASG